MREEFEKLLDVKDILNDHKITFNEKENSYKAEKVVREESVFYPSWEITYLNGAWYAFQEQQKKLDCCHDENKALLERVNTLSIRLDEALKTLLDDHVAELKGNKDEN